MSQRFSKPFSFFAQPLDRVALTTMIILGVLIGALLLMGGHSAPRVRNFSWQGRDVGADDTAFLLTFSRPMNHESVENNLRIEPPLAGKFSWAGRRMAYTLEAPAPYDTEYKVELQGATDRFTQPDDGTGTIQPFVGQFRSRDRAFVYLGVDGDEAGRLVLYNLSQQSKQVLTSPDLAVMDFEPYPDGDRILFSASRRAEQLEGLLNQKLYTVTTGIHPHAPEDPLGQRNRDNSAVASPQSPAIVAEVLDSKDYQNLKFDLSPDGQTIIVQRVNRENPADFGLWVVKPDAAPRSLATEPGGDFLIAPDSQSLAMAQGQGMAILPLESGADPLDYLPKFGMILSFARNGAAAAMVKFNTDPFNPSQSLFTVTNQGTETELTKASGSILDAQFDPTNRVLYALITERLPGDAYIEQPYLSAINLDTSERTDLLKLPIQRDIQMSISPDGLGILFDQVVERQADQQGGGLVQSDDGKAIATSRLWFLPLVLQQGKFVKQPPQELPLPGLQPRWLP